MADNIVGGLFGVDSAMLEQQKQRTLANQAFQFANLSPQEQSQYSGFLGGGMLARGAANLLGVQDPEMQKASQIKQLSSQFDLTTAAGMRQFAGALQQVAPNEAMMAAKRADEMETSGLARQKTRLDIKRAEGTVEREELSLAQEEKLRAELAALGPNATEQQVISVVTKYGSPDKILQVLSRSQDRAATRAAKTAGEDAGVAGPVGKSGAYRDADGIVYSAAEMAKQRAGFQGLEKLADNLNSITPADIKASESFIDYTQGETRKTIGGKISPKTIAAQSKINASQLLKQIESLPPGSASNADMIAAKSSFPGYGDAKNLEDWVKDTKLLLAASMQRQSDQYGFKQKVLVKGLEDTPPSPTSNQNKAALEWVAANPDDPRTPAIKKKLGIQ